MAQDEGCYFCGKERSCGKCGADVRRDLALLNQGDWDETVDRAFANIRAANKAVFARMKGYRLTYEARSAVEGVGKAQETENPAGEADEQMPKVP